MEDPAENAGVYEAWPVASRWFSDQYIEVMAMIKRSYFVYNYTTIEHAHETVRSWSNPFRGEIPRHCMPL